MDKIDLIVLIIALSLFEYRNLFDFILSLNHFWILILFINIFAIWFIIKKISIRTYFEINYN